MSEATTPARPVLPSEQRDWVTLREFEQRMSEFRALMDERTRYEREKTNERAQALDKAMALQAIEYERRLTDLNHHREETVSNLRATVQRDVYDTKMGELSRWQRIVDAQLIIDAQAVADQKALESKLDLLTVTLQRAEGALTLIRFMGFAGVVALIISFLRLAGVMTP